MKNFEKVITLIIVLFLVSNISYAQVNVNFTINTGSTHPISPYIFGMNDYGCNQGEWCASPGKSANFSLRRMGGNITTPLNWETNFSNAGSDFNQSSGYFPIVNNLSEELKNKPGMSYTRFHDSSLVNKKYSFVAIPMIGYAPADKNGTVLESETAPSSRWRVNKPFKGSAFSLTPDLTDNYVYTDELINFLVQKYGNSSSATGIKSYYLDNEIASWKATHPRMHPEEPTIFELFTKTIIYSKAIKSVDPGAKVFGGSFFGFPDFRSYTNLPEWEALKTKEGYTYFADALLDRMKKASDSVGYRLMDGIDMHFYTSAQGLKNDGTKVGAGDQSNDKGVAIARMQAPRTLWDSTYVEDSWIGQYYSPVALIPYFNYSIKKYNPGTLLCFGEWNYQGKNHISGGIAHADVFGIYAKYNVFIAAMHNTNPEEYHAAAFKIYRNYDDRNSTWGNTLAYSKTSDIENSSIYVAYDSLDKKTLHLIVINKNWDQTLNGTFSLNSSSIYTAGRVYQFNSSSYNIKEVAGITGIQNNSFSYSLPPLSVSHIILGTDEAVLGTDDEHLKVHSLNIYPNPTSGKFKVEYNLGAGKTGSLIIHDPLGRRVKVASKLQGQGQLDWHHQGKEGLYTILLLNEKRNIISSKKLIVGKN